MKRVHPRPSRTITLVALAIVTSVIGIRLHGDDDNNDKNAVAANALAKIAMGLQTFRFDTFGDDAFWSGTLKLHQAIKGMSLGGVGLGLSPNSAVNLDSPATTLTLLKDYISGLT